MSLPYIISGTVTLATVEQASLSVTIRNERTNETGTATTDSSGQYVYDIAALTSAWTLGDVITAFVQTSSYEGSTSHTILVSEGGTTLNIALAAISVGNLRYMTIQDFLNHFSLTLGNEGVPSAEHIRVIGIRVEKQIDQLTNSVWDTNASYIVTNEYHDVNNLYQDTFFLEKKPAVSITTLQANTSSQDSAASWTTLTEDTDFEADLDTGRITLMMDTESDSEAYPATGAKQVRCTYVYGQSTPQDIKRLAILMTMKDLMQSAVGKALMRGDNSFNPTTINVFDGEIDKIITNRRFASIYNT